MRFILLSLCLFLAQPALSALAHRCAFEVEVIDSINSGAWVVRPTRLILDGASFCHDFSRQPQLVIFERHITVGSSLAVLGQRVFALYQEHQSALEAMFHWEFFTSEDELPEERHYESLTFPH